MATGIEFERRLQAYEFGDTLNLDITPALAPRHPARSLGLPLNFEYSDLQVQSVRVAVGRELRLSLMLDCSHP